jgi:nicotinamidase/pyrazinamidase
MADAGITALVVADVQPDFMPGGALPTQQGEGVIEPITRLLASPRFDLCVATQDWHPPGHISFASRHGRTPMETIDLYGHEQTLWPDHCVQGSAGAQLHPALGWNRIAAIIRKGADPDTDSYSGFRNNWNAQGNRPPTGLAGYLHERNISDIYLCGLARDICVKWSAEDAVDAGFRTWYIWDATRPVDPQSDDRVRAELTARGVHIIDMAELDL